jgi:hypothetical protein
METALIALFPTLTFCGLIFPAFVSFKRESGPKYAPLNNSTEAFSYQQFSFSLKIFKTLSSMAFYDFYSCGDLFGCSSLAEIRNNWNDTDRIQSDDLELDDLFHVHDLSCPAGEVQPCRPPPYSRPARESFYNSIIVQYKILSLATAYRRVKFGDEKYSANTTRTVFIIDSFTSTLYIFGRVPLSFIVHFYLVKMKVPRAIGTDIL